MSFAYAQSAGHASGDDLETVVAFAAPSADMHALDVATGSGNTAAAIAPHVESVVAIDIAPAMLERTRELAIKRGLTNVSTELMDVEAMRFPDACFELVTSRIAPHHFLDIDRALREIARVVVRSGAFVVEDSVVPEDPQLDRFLNDIEILRDPTHIRSLTPSEWRSKLIAAGFIPTRETTCRKTHDIAEWIGRAGLDAAGIDAVYDAFAAAPPSAIAAYSIEVADGRAIRFTDEKIIIRAEKM